MYECGKMKKVIGNKFLFPVILEQCEGCLTLLYQNIKRIKVIDASQDITSISNKVLVHFNDLT